jgi:hypothetical protein
MTHQFPQYCFLLINFLFLQENTIFGDNISCQLFRIISNISQFGLEVSLPRHKYFDIILNNFSLFFKLGYLLPFSRSLFGSAVSHKWPANSLVVSPTWGGTLHEIPLDSYQPRVGEYSLHKFKSLLT